MGGRSEDTLIPYQKLYELRDEQSQRIGSPKDATARLRMSFLIFFCIEFHQQPLN